MLNIKIFLSLFLLLMVLSACSPATATAQPTIPPAAVPVTVIVEPTRALPQTSNLPQDDAAVPRVSVEQAKEAVDSGDAVLVDVRGPNSYARGHIAGALEISVSAIVTNPGNLPLDKNKWIITYCTWQDEHTSARAAFTLLYNGYPRVSALLGGMTAWEAAGYPME